MNIRRTMTLIRDTVAEQLDIELVNLTIRDISGTDMVLVLPYNIQYQIVVDDAKLILTLNGIQYTATNHHIERIVDAVVQDYTHQLSQLGTVVLRQYEKSKSEPLLNLDLMGLTSDQVRRILDIVDETI